MEAAEPVKSGYLLVPGQGFLKKIWNKRYYALYGASNNGIQRLEMFDNEECSLRQSPAKIIPLTDCIKVNSVLQKNQNNVFEVRTKEHVHMFSADSYHEMNDWLSNIQGVAFGSGVKPPFVKAPEVATPSSLVISQHEDNLIYSSVDAPETYPVSLIESESTIRCKLQGSYQLLLTSVGITLSDPNVQNPTKATFMWSYRHIRRYGYSNTTFSFEAGRKAASGEGLFTFNTNEGARIFQSIATRVNSLKTFKNEMEQHSPSPQSESPTFSDVLNRNTLGKTNKEHGYGIINSTTPIPKPPRRSKLSSECLPLPLPENGNIYEDPQLVDKLGEDDYDEPEERQNAWKTLGQDSTDSYPIMSDPTYEDLSYASADAIQVPDIGKLSLVSENGKHQSNSLPRNNLVQSNLYGKVNNKRNTIVSKGPDYENLLMTGEGNGLVPNDSDSVTKRILCNDVEYAQIIRKKK